MSEKTGDLRFYIDLDDTAAHGTVAEHAMVYDRLLGLGIGSVIGVKSPSDRREKFYNYSKRFKKTFDIPQIISFRNESDENERRFQEVRNAIRTSRALHRKLSRIKGSDNGVKYLDSYGTRAGYFTVRPAEIEGASQDWLERHGFPDHENVVICDNHRDKISKILAENNDSEKGVKKVLIDDSVKGLTQAIIELGETQSLEDFVLVGFGLSPKELKDQVSQGIIEAMPDTRTDDPIKFIKEQFGALILPLESWETEKVDHLINRLQTLQNRSAN